MKEVSELLEMLNIESEFNQEVVLLENTRGILKNASFPDIHFNGSQIPKRIRKAPLHQRVKYDGTGRNDLCPCGGGRKYKKCCINQPQTKQP